MGVARPLSLPQVQHLKLAEAIALLQDFHLGAEQSELLWHWEMHLHLTFGSRLQRGFVETRSAKRKNI